jgi:hypothetical protein
MADGDDGDDGKRMGTGSDLYFIMAGAMENLCFGV